MKNSTENTINEIIRRALRETKITQQMFAEMIGKKRQSEISAFLSYKNMTFNTAIMMLDALGYEIIVRPRRSGRRAADEVVVESSKSAPKES